MPIEPTPISEGVNYGQTYVSHTNGVQFLVTIAPGSGPAETDADEATQSMLDHLQAWPDRDTAMPDLETTKSETQSYRITPTEE